MSRGVAETPPNPPNPPPGYYHPPPPAHNPGFQSQSPYMTSSSQNQPPIMMQPMSSSKIGTYEYRHEEVYQKEESSSSSSRYVNLPPGQQPPQYNQVYQPHTMQPGQQQHQQPTIIVPVVPTNVPPGLAYLAILDRVFIRQKIELLEIISGCETKNKYKILDPNGHQIFSAKEDTDCCTRNCLGPIRPFDIIVKDGMEQEVIHLSRPFACGSCCFPCCLQSIDVESPPGTLIGRIEQDWTLWIPKYRVLNAQGEVVLRIKGPCCTISCCNDVDFHILSKDGSTKVGKISKHWSGLLREAFTDADNFGISFPMDLDVKMKAVMIGAALLIDFMFFEKKNNNDD